MAIRIFCFLSKSSCLNSRKINENIQIEIKDDDIKLNLKTQNSATKTKNQ